MNLLAQQRRRARIRAKITGTAQRPRLVATISQRHVVAQLVDDTSGTTLGYVTTVGAKVSGTLTDKAIWAGEQIAAKAATKKVKRVVFDRAGRIYHGRLAALATAARAKGLEF